MYVSSCQYIKVIYVCVWGGGVVLNECIKPCMGVCIYVRWGCVFTYNVGKCKGVWGVLLTL